MKSLFVGNLSFQTTETELNDLFKPFGQSGRVKRPSAAQRKRLRSAGKRKPASNRRKSPWSRRRRSKPARWRKPVRLVSRLLPVYPPYLQHRVSSYTSQGRVSVLIRLGTSPK